MGAAHAADKSAAPPGGRRSKHPSHRVVIEPCAKRVRVVFNGETIADTVRAWVLLETGLRPVYYFPPEDVRVEFLEPSRRSTVCPYKGWASYWSLRVGERFAENAVWSYRKTLPECSRIKDYLCFYPDKVERIEVERE